MTGRPLTVQVRFDPETVPQAQLPWELLHDGLQHLVLDEHLHFNRYITFYGNRKPFTPVDELNILYVISRPRDLANLDHYAEKREVEAALQGYIEQGKVAIDVLEEATFAAFQRQLGARDYHLVHWDGHGAFAEHDREGVLAFETAHETTEIVTASRFAEALRGAGVRLVILSACQSATLRGNRILNSVGPALIRARVPAVVAMQFSIPLASTMAFTGEFYRSLARGEPVAAAVADGRKAMTQRWQTWFYPALYLRAAEGDGYLFSVEPEAHFEERQDELAALHAEWRKMPEAERVAYPEGPPDVEDYFDDEASFEDFMELVEEMMDAVETVQELIEAVSELLDEGGDGDGGDGEPPVPGAATDAPPAPQEPTLPPLVPGQGYLTVENSLGAQYQLAGVAGGYGFGHGDSTLAVQADTYTIRVGFYDVGQATVEEGKETAVQLQIGLAHLKLAHEGAGYAIVDASNQQNLGGLDRLV